LVTERITAAMESGTVPWQKPWASLGGIPRNLSSGRPYRGMNVLLLSLGQPYASPWWLTYKQAQDLGGQVRKGEKASLVTFWKFPRSDTAPEEGEKGEGAAEPEHRRAPLLRHYHVFNLEQVDGIPAPPSQEFQPKAHERMACCEAVVAEMPQRPSIQRDPRQACYAPGLDKIGIPDLSQFETPEAYYGTLYHELVHSTGHPSRLARAALDSPSPFGSPDYSREELVAEFGAAFLCAHAGILPRTVDNSAAYIQGWLSVLKGDKRLLPVAAAQAQRAVDFILGPHLGAEEPAAGEERL
jgi:antirestriction protein ArdC